jgi:hypothetical protein
LLAKLAELHPENDFMVEHVLLRFDLPCAIEGSST